MILDKDFQEFIDKGHITVESLTPANMIFLKELKEAIEEVKLIKDGKLKGIPAHGFLDKL